MLEARGAEALHAGPGRAGHGRPRAWGGRHPRHRSVSRVARVLPGHGGQQPGLQLFLRRERPTRRGDLQPTRPDGPEHAHPAQRDADRLPRVLHPSEPPCADGDEHLRGGGDGRRDRGHRGQLRLRLRLRRLRQLRRHGDPLQQDEQGLHHAPARRPHERPDAHLLLRGRGRPQEAPLRLGPVPLGREEPQGPAGVLRGRHSTTCARPTARPGGGIRRA